MYWFGKHKGKPLDEVPSDYHQWALRTDKVKLSSGLRSAVVAVLEARGVSAPPPPAPKRFPCHRCGGFAMQFRWMQDAKGRRQIRKECRACAAWNGFAPQQEPFISEADQAASPTAILDALTLAEQEGVRITSDGDQVRIEDWRKASEKLKALVRQQGHQLARMLGKGACA